MTADARDLSPAYVSIREHTLLLEWQQTLVIFHLHYLTIREHT